MSQKNVIRAVAANFVPVAVNLYKVRNAKDAGGDLFRSVQRQRDQYQGIWIVSPAGKVLAGHHDIKEYKNWANEVLATIDAGLKSFGEVSPRKIGPTDPLPYRGKGIQENGAVSLALYTRYMHEGRRDGPTVIDSLTLSAQEWAALTPTKLESGATWSVPEDVARRFCKVLSPSSDQSTMPRPGEVTAVQFTGTIEKIADGLAVIQYTGHIAAAHVYDKKTSHGKADLTGNAVYDLKGQQLCSLSFVFEGIHRGPPPYDSPRHMGAVVEWRRGADK